VRRGLGDAISRFQKCRAPGPATIMTMVADTSRIRSTLDWTPRNTTILDNHRRGTALAMGRETVFRERGGDVQTGRFQL